jgi:penicillin-binding protein 1A
VATGSKTSSGRDNYVPKHAPSKRSKTPSSGAPKKSFLRRRWWLLVLLTPVVLGMLSVIGLAIAYARLQLPDKLPPIRTTYLYDRHGKPLANLHGAVDRTIVPLSKVSDSLVDAVIATEDHEFYEHMGVDVRGLARAAWVNFRGTDNEVQGASTITQQLVKNVYAGTYGVDDNGLPTYEPPPRSIPEKLREALMAVKVERTFGKDKILAQYLNTVYFGHGAYGIEAAAQTYFGKSAKDLTVLESATLAGVLHAPESYDPIDRPYDNVFRRDYALDQMVRYGYLDAAEAKALKQEPCCGTIPDSDARIEAPGQAEYFVEYTRGQLFDRYGEAAVYGGGLRITTTLDLGLQRAAEEAVAAHLPNPEVDPEAALVSVDVQTGEILAMVGGRNWKRSQVNLATFPCEGCGRQAGSAFKAITLAAAMKEGYDLRQRWSGPNTMAIPGCPDPEQPDGLWHPVNAEGSGDYTLADATVHSVNTIYAQLIAQMGPEKVVDMAHLLGIRSKLDPYCSITLGSVAIDPLELTNVYATLAARGIRHRATPLHQVEFPSGRTEDRFGSRGTPVLATNDADLVTSALEGVVDRGTGASANIPTYYIAGKTGTANENVDAWFCGYTVQIATCVWVGHVEGEIPLVNVEGVPLVFGGTIPAAIWRDYMTVALEGTEPTPFVTPTFDGYTLGPTSPVPSPTLPPCSLESPEVDENGSPVPCVPVSESPSPTVTKSPKPSPTPSPTPSPSPSPTTSPTPSPTTSKSPKPSPTTTP